MVGALLGLEEEFSPGQNAFVDDEGNVVSQVVGRVVENRLERTLDVVPHRAVVSVSPGVIVVGTIVSITDHVAIVDPISAELNGARVGMPNVTFAIPVSKCDSGFVRNLREKFRLGDIVKAQVESVLPWGVDLSTQSRELGVLKAFCKACRLPLHLFGTELKCLQCAVVDSRKVSSEYMLR